MNDNQYKEDIEKKQKKLIYNRAYNKIWRKTKKGKVSNNKSQKKYYLKNTKALIEKAIKWEKDNPERKRLITRKSQKRRYWEKKFIFYIAFINQGLINVKRIV